MATLETTRLTEAHRLAQARLGAQTIQAMRATWPLLDPQSIDATLERWLTATMPLVRAQRSASARLAGNYLATVKGLELGTTQAPLVLGEAIPSTQLATSLLVTGPYHLRKALSRGVPFDRALSVAEATSAAAGYRHALNGGRSTIVDTVNADRDAVGWRRIASGGACDFCRMLAGRGAVYREQTASFDAHDACSCSAEPVYRA